jgi:hypothetical protein
MSGLIFRQLLHDSNGLQYPWAALHLCGAFCAMLPATIHLPGTLRLGLLVRAHLVNGDVSVSL